MLKCVSLNRNCFQNAKERYFSPWASIGSTFPLRGNSGDSIFLKPYHMPKKSVICLFTLHLLGYLLVMEA